MAINTPDHDIERVNSSICNYSKRPSLEDLLSQCDPVAAMPANDVEWEILHSVGNELL
jgi:hypothetical protein